MLTVGVSHRAECPEVDPVTCATEDVPPHTHDLRTTHGRLDLGLALGLGQGWQVSASVPLELRVVDVTYRTLDGALYAPPYDDIHHRDETLAGPADGEARVQHLQRLGAWTVGAEAGATLPFGRTEADPYAAGEAGETHEHNQFGAGVPLLLAGGSALRRPTPWGVQASLGARIAVLENARGYRAPHTLSVAAGPSRAFGPRVVTFVAAGLVREGPERWEGEAYGGRTAVVAQLGGEWAPTRGWSLLADLRLPVWQHLDEHEDHDEDGSLRMGPRVAVGVAWTP